MGGETGSGQAGWGNLRRRGMRIQVGETRKKRKETGEKTRRERERKEEKKIVWYG